MTLIMAACGCFLLIGVARLPGLLTLAALVIVVMMFVAAIWVTNTP